MGKIENWSRLKRSEVDGVAPFVWKHDVRDIKVIVVDTRSEEVQATSSDVYEARVYREGTDVMDEGFNMFDSWAGPAHKATGDNKEEVRQQAVSWMESNPFNGMGVETVGDWKQRPRGEKHRTDLVNENTGESMTITPGDRDGKWLVYEPREMSREVGRRKTFHDSMSDAIEHAEEIMEAHPDGYATR